MEPKIPSDLYENIAAYLDEDTFVNFVQTSKIKFSYHFWVDRFQHDRMPVFFSIAPVTPQGWQKEYIKLHRIKNIVKNTIKNFKAHGNLFIYLF